MKNIIVVGSLNMDLVTNVAYTPKVGETVLGMGFDEIPGGKGANQAAALGKLGASVKMVGKVGLDDFGKKLIDNLNKVNVDTESVKISNNQPTGIAIIMVNQSGDNSIVVISGANFDLTNNDMTDDIIKNTDIVLAQLETPVMTVKELFYKAKKQNIYTVLNPAPAQNLDDEFISYIDLLIPNETEFEIISGIKADSETNIKAGANNLFRKGVKELIITLGEKGSVYITKDKYLKFDAFKVKAIDTTAAGDSFIGGLLFQISKGKSVEDAIPFASKVAALAVMKKGAQSSLPSYEEVMDFKGDDDSEKR